MQLMLCRVTPYTFLVRAWVFGSQPIGSKISQVSREFANELLVPTVMMWALFAMTNFPCIHFDAMMTHWLGPKTTQEFSIPDQSPQAALPWQYF
jgi:hypothetical protein